jgi:hypothetical protein
LYDLRADFSQARNLADEHPQRLLEMQALFDEQARENNVYPIHDSGAMTRVSRMLQAAGNFRTEYVFWGPDIGVQLMSAPPIQAMPFSLKADIVVPEGGGNGVIVAAGSYFGGWSFYLDDGKPVAYAAVSPLSLAGMQSRIEAPTILSAGAHSLRFDVDFAGEGGTVTISVDGNDVASGPVAKRPHTLAGNGETFDTGRDTNDPVSRDYQGQGVFDGEIRKIEVKIRPTVSVMLKGAVGEIKRVVNEYLDATSTD